MFSHCFSVFAPARSCDWGGIVAGVGPGPGGSPALGERGRGREADFNDGKLLVIVHIIMCDVLCS